MTKVLITWSGGIDSTYTLAWMLSNTDWEIHAHHAHILNHEGRAEAENKAIKTLIPKLSAIRPFTYSENLIDHSSRNAIPFDMSVMCFEAGVMIREHGYANKPFDFWTIGTHKDEGHWQERWNVIEPAAKAACWPIAYPGFKLINTVTKKEEINFLGSLGLFKDTWYCRTPSSTGTVCRKCKTCREVNMSFLPVALEGLK